MKNLVDVIVRVESGVNLDTFMLVRGNVKKNSLISDTIFSFFLLLISSFFLFSYRPIFFFGLEHPILVGTFETVWY